ncbi:hypothetical protein HWV62_26879 [Athelia sp. TMB]|nr:hypothetical protein HWV62_26879 [Athelia sp. TMB]
MNSSIASQGLTPNASIPPPFLNPSQGESLQLSTGIYLVTLGRLLEQSAGIERFERVLFLNDIIFCAADILEILYEHDAQHADMTPSYALPDLLTYFGDPPPDPSPVPQPFPANPPARAALDQLAPFQVFSCWNGAVVMPTKEGEEEGDTRGTGRGVVRFRTARNDASTVTERQSECFLVPVDLWKRGMGRVMVVPRASVTYSGHNYAEVRQDGGRLPGTAHPAHVAYRPLPAPGEDTQIQCVRAPPAQVAYHNYAWWHAPERWGAWDEA